MYSRIVKWFVGALAFLMPSLFLLVCSLITPKEQPSGNNGFDWLIITTVLAAILPAGLILTAQIKWRWRIIWLFCAWGLLYFQVLGIIVFVVKSVGAL
jgi:hypothetical protein